MKIAGMGFRTSAGIDALRSALMAAGGAEGIVALATVQEKAQAPSLVAFAAELGLPIYAVTSAAMTDALTPTQSERMLARFGTGSLAEAAALVAAGPSASLLGPRAVSADGSATAAIAERRD